MRARLARRLRKTIGAKGFTLLELIVAMSLSVFVLIGVIQAAASIIAVQLDTHRRGAAEGYSLVGALQLMHDLRDASYLQCPGTGPLSNTCSPATSNQGNILSGCTNWSTQRNGQNVAGVMSANVIPAPDECQGSLVKSFYYCTPAPSHNPGADVRLVRYVTCGATCSIPAPGGCGNPAAGATMSTLIPATPGFFQMDNLNFYYERADDVAGAALHFIVGIGTATTAGNGTRAAPIPVSFKYNMRLGMTKSYNLGSD